MKKGLVGVVLMLCVCVGGATVYQKLSADRVAPQIVFEEDMTYHDGMTNEELLKGVKAEDAKDGDVSDSLVVEACSPDPAQGQAIVRYVARDARNNVARVNRVLSYEGYEQETESETEKRKESAVTKHSEKETAAETDSEKEDQSESETEFESETETETESEELEPGAPVIRLSENHAQISVGSNFNPLNYVASVSDDSDDKYTLWRDIQLSGDYDVNKAGVYHLTYYVINSQGIRSNSAKFTLTVK